MADFILFAVSSTGQTNIPDCQVRVLDASEQDVTPLLTGGQSPLRTGEDGGYVHSFAEGMLPPLPPGSYSVMASAPGYESYSGPFHQAPANFTGFGIVSFRLTPLPVGTGTTVTRSESKYVSPMYPVEVLVDAQAPSAPWELIETTVTNSAGTSSVIEVPVIGGIARVNLQARLILEPSLVLVPDGQYGIIDPSFSDTFIATFKSLTPTGSFPIAGSVEVRVANAFPPGLTNDLSDYTNDAGDGGQLAQWLTPWAELGVPKFRGRYADAMIWLPLLGAGPYTLGIEYQDINQDPLTSSGFALDSALFTPKRIVRIRIPEPATGAHYGQLRIYLAGIAQTTPLKIRYIHG